MPEKKLEVPKEIKEEQLKNEVVEPEEIQTEENFLDKVLEEGSEVGEMTKQQIRYLRNDGEPAAITVMHQRHVYWKDKEGKRRMIEIVLPSREGMETAGGKGNDEQEKARQLKLVEGEKALLYYQPTGEITKKVVDANYSFVVWDYPHILSAEFGEGTGIMAKKRRYACLVGQTIKVVNQMDFSRLWRTFGFLNEVDDKGKIINENSYTIAIRIPPKKVQGNIPTSFGDLPNSQILKASPEYVSEIKEADDEETNALIEDEKENPSPEL